MGVPPSRLTSLPADCWKLLETYCTYTQCWLPICDKLDILKLSYSYPKQGLALSCDMSGSGSGSHAEMWSIFAVGCDLEDPHAAGGHRRTVSATELYDVARLLISNELGRFDLDHVRALLNLAVFNIHRSLLNAAWHLVGSASRIALALDDVSDAVVARRRNVLSGCFLLDNLLSLQLKRRPYLDRSDLAHLGKIEEDGMEEWQLWDGYLATSPVVHSRSPTLALSSFNALLGLVDILVGTEQQPSARNFLHEMIGRLEMWKSSLPPKLDYIRNVSTPTPMTPPALLLQLAYLTTAFVLVPSQAWLQQVLEALDIAQSSLGIAKIPAVVACLLQSIARCSATLSLDQTTRSRMRKSFAAFGETGSESLIKAFVNLQDLPSIMEVTSPDTSRMTQTSPRAFPSAAGQYQPSLNTSSDLNDMLLDTNSNLRWHELQSLNSNPFNFAMIGPILDPFDTYNALVTGDGENVLDNFASEHGSIKLQNQPQFMENLGFSSGVSMADLLAADPSRFMPTASQWGAEQNEDTPQFPLNAFYEAG
jgi:hypothetical protein